MIRPAISTLALLAGTPAQAQDVTALVLGFPDAGAPMAFADSYNVAQALRAAGVGEVRLMRDTTLAEIGTGWDLTDPDIVYVAGALPAALRPRVEGAGRPDLLLLDDCAAPSAMSGDGIARASSGGLCETGGLAARLADTPTPQVAADLVGLLGDAWTGAVPAAVPLTPRRAAPAAGTEAVAVVGDSVVSITPVSPVAPVAAGTAAGALAQGDGDVAIFVAPPVSQQAAIPAALGLPEPSIIIGIIEPQNASFETVEEDAGIDDVAGSEIAFDNLEARVALRESDPELFETLVTGGAFDPPDVQLAASLQTELQRMGCYTARIDGDWGRGSRASVERYFAEVEGQSAETLDPTIGLFRQIIRNEDVDCPAPVVAAPVRQAAPARTTTRTNTRATTRQAAPARTTTRQAAPTRTAPARTAPAPARQQPRRTIRRTLGSGVFR